MVGTMRLTELLLATGCAHVFALLLYKGRCPALSPSPFLMHTGLWILTQRSQPV